MSKNVLLISHFPPPYGGIATWTKRVMEHEIPNWNIHFVNSSTIAGRDPFKSPKRNLFVELKRARNIYKNEKRILKTEKIDVVHDNIPCTLFGTLRELETARIANKFKVPFILHCRCTVPNVVNSAFKRFWYKKLLKRCSGVIVLNQKSYDFIKSLNKDVYVEIIPNFVLEKEIADDFEVKEKLTKLSYVGGVVKEKGCQLIYEVAPKFPDIKFELVGNINEEISSLPKPDNVELLGAIDPSQVKSYLDSCDGFLFLSKYFGEGFSNSLAEAMAHGLPCIATDWAANKDMLENQGGVVIDVDSMEQLVAGIEKIRSFEVRKEMSQWNIKKVKEQYSADVVINRYAKFYETMCEYNKHNKWGKK